MERLDLPRNTQDPVQNAIVKFIVVPFIFIIGIIIVGALIEDSFDIPNAAIRIFQIAGGVSFIGYYYYRQLRKYFD